MNILQPGLVMNPSAGGPVGAPPMAQHQDFAQMAANDQGMNSVVHFNTCIYDYFLRGEKYELARVFLKSYQCKTTPRSKQNGAMDLDKKEKRPEDLPDPDIPGAPGDPAFLESWWQCFWDMFSAVRGQKTTTITQLHQQYLMQQRARQSVGNGAMLPGGRPMGQYNNMVNGVMAKNMQNRNVTPQAITAMQGKMMGQQLQRDPAAMEMNGQRPQTPGDNAPSPSKRPRIDNGSYDGQSGMMTRQVSVNPQGGQMGANGNQAMMANGQMAGFAPGGAPLKMENMNGIPQGAMGGQAMESGDNRHALQDYQMQLMLLEQQNKKRLMQANRDRDTIVGANNAGTPGGGFAAPNMSPSGSRGAVPSPTPGDQMKRIVGTPKMAQQAIPGSPMTDMQNRASPAPNFDPSAAQMQPGGMPQQYYTNMGGNQLARPQTSHPNFTMNMAAMNQQTMEQMRMAANGRLANGQPWPQGANPAMQGNPQNPAMRNPQQGPGTMGPPPAPAGEQQAVSQRTQPSSPAQPAAPPTPSQSKAAPKKKENTQKKKAATKKGSTAGATPAADSSDLPISTPSTPITPMHNASFSKASGTQPSAATATTAVASAPQSAMDPNATAPGGFGGMVDDANGYSLEFAGVDTNDVLENFDFDSFLHTDDVSNIGMDFAFDSGVADTSV